MIRPDGNGLNAEGVYEGNRIIIKRSVLNNITRFLGVLVHEFAHYNSGASDNTRAFENVLTDMLGYALTQIYRHTVTDSAPRGFLD